MEIEKIVSSLREYADKLEAAGFGMELLDTMREASDKLESAGWLSDIAAGLFSGGNDNMAAQEYRESKLAEKWVSVKDGLPEIYRDVLTYAEMRYGPEGVCKDIYIGHVTECGAFALDTKDRTGAVTHWQLLPPPPKE